VGSCVTIAVCLYAFWTSMWTTWVSFGSLNSLNLCVGCWDQFVATGPKFFHVTQKGAMSQKFRQGEWLLPHWLRYWADARWPMVHSPYRIHFWLTSTYFQGCYRFLTDFTLYMIINMYSGYREARIFKFWRFPTTRLEVLVSV
jgi:hypothetical protein